MRLRVLGDHSQEHCGCQAVMDVLNGYLLRHGEIVEDGEEYDTLVVNGEGSMHHDRRNCMVKMEAIADAQRANRRTFLVNTVWDRNSAALTPILQALSNIVVRGRMSAIDLAENHGVNSHISIDFSYFRDIDPAPFQDLQGAVAMTDVWASDAYGFCWPNRNFSASFVPVDMTAQCWSSLVRSLETARLVIAGRHHALYAACKARVAFVAVRGNCHKMEDLLSITGSRIPVCDNIAEIPQALRWAERYPSEYERLFDWMERQKLPDFLHDTAIKDRASVIRYKRVPFRTQAQSAQAKGDFQTTFKMWMREAQTINDDEQRGQIHLRAFRCLCRLKKIDDCFDFLAGLDPEALEKNSADYANALIDMTRDRNVWSSFLFDPIAEHQASSAMALARRAVQHAGAFDDREALASFRSAMERFGSDHPGAELRVLFCLSILMGMRTRQRFRMTDILREAERYLHLLPNTTASAAAGPLALFFDAETLLRIYERASGESKARLLESSHFVRSNFDFALREAVAMLRSGGDEALAYATLKHGLWTGDAGVVEEADDIVSRFALAPAGTLALAHRMKKAGHAPDAADAGLAARFEQAQGWRSRFERLVREGAESFAIVGSSPCETGLGKGTQIDAHSHVVRFNNAFLAADNEADYGSRCDVLAVTLFATDLPKILEAYPLDRDLLVNAPSLYDRNFDASVFDERLERGGRIVFVPGEHYRRMCGLGVQSPSLGLVVTAYLKSLAPRMGRERFYGFSFTDQLPGGAAHYFGAQRTSELHDWQRERAIFDGLFETP